MRILSIKNIESSLLRITILASFVMIPVFAAAQPEKKYLRQGNREYGKEKFQESEVSYRRALAGENKPDAIFNIGDALYKQNKFDEAAKHFTDNINMNDDPGKRSAGLYNLGNSLLQAKKIKESIEAYKGSLKLDPDNLEAKYNLAYAQDLLKEQEQQEQQQQQNNDNQDKQEKKDQDKQKDDQKNQDDKQDQQQKQQQAPEQSISKEDAQRLLNSLANDEKNVQEKVKLAKAARERKLTVKNW